MRSRMTAITLVLIIVIGFVFLVYKGKKVEITALGNIPQQEENLPSLDRGLVEEKREKVTSKVEDVVDLSKEYFAEFINSTTPVVVDFWASNCGACRMLEPVFQEVASEMKDRIKFAKFMVDAKGNWEIAEKYNVRLTPTMIVFKDGKELGRLIGYRGKDELKSALENFL